MYVNVTTGEYFNVHAEMIENVNQNVTVRDGTRCSKCGGEIQLYPFVLVKNKENKKDFVHVFCYEAKDE